jgi:hypothetical protein
LLKAEELDNPQVDRWVQAQSALIGADGVIELDAESAIDLNFAPVIHSGHAEHDNPIRHNDAMINLGFHVFGMFRYSRLQGGQDFLDGLVEFWLAGVLLLHIINDFLYNRRILLLLG